MQLRDPRTAMCRGAPRTGLPFVLPVSFDKIDNNNNNNNNNNVDKHILTNYLPSQQN